ncbi:enoyl-CoA delta isomerase 2-like protein [Leptotrombidium deliense]|uniref:Enoyl-CoA delta isomerase 2-like protein n=1 Tax=Leptotrombidium deliense TaxID=299467 RepID=A0A443S4G8_9ACAR|nr:enoyl-CoA delta isomerase 2-like protein [Leptotrombidium deliense]
MDSKFKEALDKVPNLKEDPGNEAKLKLYGLFKQATVGKCNQPKPGAFDFVAKYKWDAWNTLGELSQADAKKQYVETVEQLVSKIGLSGGTSTSSSLTSGSESDMLVIQKRDGVLSFRLNRPDKFNAIRLEMYETFIEQLKNAASDDSVRLVFITGTGDYYSSGNDLAQFLEMGVASPEDVKKMAEKARGILEKYVASFIDFPKPIIGAINGPAIGVMVTTLALFDVVVCSDTTTFQTPFSSTGQSPEGCSSVLFPQLFGVSRANKLLMLNDKISAMEALNAGFVAKIFPKPSFEKDVEEMIYGEKGILKNCAQGSLVTAKSLIRNSAVKQILHAANKAECDALLNRWLSPDFPKIMAKFFARKK